MRRSAVVLCAWLSACGTDFEAAVFLTIKPPADDGGWHVDLRATDGASIEGFRPRWVAAQSGVDPSVNLLVTQAKNIPGAKLRARVHVVRRDKPDGPALAQGAVVVDFQKGSEVSATVELTADPRPLASFALARIESNADGGSAWVDTSTISAIAGWEMNLWLIDPETRWHWIGRPAPGSAAWFLGPQGGALIGRFVGAQISVEPEGMSAPMQKSLGWKGYKGLFTADLLAGLRKALVAADDTPDGMGYLAEFNMSYAIAVAHAGFAQADALGGNVPSARVHCEHVYNALVGQGREVDLTGDGAKDFPELPWPRTALTGPQGYARRALNAVSSAAESAAAYFPELATWTSQASACETATSTAALAVLDAASDAAQNLTVPAVQLMADLVADVADGMSDGAVPTFRCLYQNIERLATLKLAPVAKGTD